VENDPEGLGVAQAPGSFQWTIGDISRSSAAAWGKVYTGFLYDGDPMSCNVGCLRFFFTWKGTSADLYNWLGANNIGNLCILHLPISGYQLQIQVSAESENNFLTQLRETILMQ
jgi:hypothetical protein